MILNKPILKIESNAEVFFPWLSVYIYNKDINKLLRQCISPIVASAFHQKLITSFFFIRYGDEVKGPHIRLRLKAVKKEDKKLLVNELEPFLTILQKNGTVKDYDFVDYIPETARYGGSRETKMAEKIFYHSSNLGLEYFSTPEISYPDAIKTAIGLNLIMVLSMGLSTAEAGRFFQMASSVWLSTASNLYLDRYSDTKERVDHLISAFKTSYLSQKEALSILVKRIVQAVKEDLSFQEPYLNRWRKSMQGFSTEFQAISEFYPPFLEYHKKLLNSFKEMDPKWLILESYMHMSNNRMGLRNHDEAFISYAIMQVLNEYDNG